MIILCNECGLIYNNDPAETDTVVICPNCAKLQFLNELYEKEIIHTFQGSNMNGKLNLLTSKNRLREAKENGTF